MKKSTTYLGSILMILLLASCSATNRLTMNAVEPAPVFLSPDIKKVLIVNLSRPSESRELADQIDRILSAEGLKLDEKGAQAAVIALKESLIEDSRFQEVILADSVGIARNGLGVFPPALDAETVQELCRKYGADVLYALEFYDSNTLVSYAMTTRELPNSFGIKVKIPYHKVTLNTRILNGWRIYDPTQPGALDEWGFERAVIAVGEGPNPIRAVEAVMGRNAAVITESRDTGIEYAWRIRPVQTRIARDYFIRGTENFEIAKRRARTGDWDGAAQLWSADVSHPNSRVAGRACYNMAINSEINGRLGEALDWASRAYSDYNNREALRYTRLLQHRLAEQEELHRQMRYQENPNPALSGTY